MLIKIFFAWHIAMLLLGFCFLGIAFLFMGDMIELSRAFIGFCGIFAFGAIVIENSLNELKKTLRDK